ncbi:MAG: protein-glutamate O-methyltransferase CheR [Nitrospirae bacterium]|nr:protein-glutamate O-methyltransferase CheR [Nitrospirota bacterium]
MLSTKNIQMSNDVFYTLRDMIYERSGIYFSDHKKYILENRLLRRVEDGGFGDFEKYAYFLRYDHGREREFTTLFNIITTNETSFFRDSNQLHAFESVVLPQTMQNMREKGIRRLRIWSSACSTGEEPYTLAMLVLSRLSQAEGRDWDIEIHGSDISEGVLSSARRGEYNDYSLRNVLPQYLDRYFSKNGNGRYAVRPEVKKMVRLSSVNLFDNASLRMFRGMDIIFCRNVLIYFDEAAKKRVISGIYDCLVPGGYLFMGHAESLLNISRAFKLVNINNILIYQK